MAARLRRARDEAELGGEGLGAEGGLQLPPGTMRAWAAEYRELHPKDGDDTTASRVRSQYRAVSGSMPERRTPRPPRPAKRPRCTARACTCKGKQCRFAARCTARACACEGERCRFEKRRRASPAAAEREPPLGPPLQMLPDKLPDLPFPPRGTSEELAY